MEFNKDKVKLKIAISKMKEENDVVMENKTKNIFKTIITTILSIVVGTGVVFAGTIVYENVWKEPKKFNSYNDLIEDIRQTQGSQEVTTDDKEKAVNMDEAVIEANNFLNKFGYQNQEFVKKELKKNYVQGAELAYYFSTDNDLNKGIHIYINAENGKCVGFINEDLKYDVLKTDTLSKEMAEELVNNMYNLLKVNKDEYKIKTIEEVPHYFQNREVAKFWNVMLYKDYEGALNQFERIEMRFAVSNGALKVYQMGIINENVEYKDNPVVISQNDAEKIALEESKKINDNEIDWVTTKLQIRQINSYIWVLEQNGGKYPELKEEIQEDGSVQSYPEYKIVENTARKVWCVNIHYKKGKEDPNNEKKYNSLSIFVDVTTGEVIGGADESYWD